MVKGKVLVVGAALGAALLVATPAFACHPKGSIVKKVQDVTSGSALVDANNASDALTVKTGDTLKYVITVANNGASGDVNDLINTVLKDTLPAGVELTTGGTAINENLGTIHPGKSVTKEYMVKVTSAKNGDVVTNKACFTGDSTDYKLPQSGCDNAVVTVSVPVTPVTPTPPVTPTTPETPVTPSAPAPQLPVTLPSTGPEALVGTTLTLAAAAYATVFAVRNKKQLITLLNK